MKRTMKRCLASTALLSAFLLSGLPPASADDHYVRIFPKGEDQICNFNFAYAATGGKLQTRSWEDEDGNTVRFIQAGKGVVLTYYRLDDEFKPVRSVSINTAGSVIRIVANKDGSSTAYLTGHYGLLLEKTDVGGPGAIQYLGRAVYTISPTGVWEEVSTAGQSRDICAELAS